MNASEAQLFQYFIIGGFVSGAIVFLFLFFVPAPYGRHVRSGWGPQLPVRLGWVLMESVSSIGFAAWFFSVGGPYTVPAWIFLLMWQWQYVYRAFVYPFRLRKDSKQMPLLIIVFGMVFNTFNSYLNGRYLGVHAPDYTTAWLTDPRFLIGVALFITGTVINRRADKVLFHLRDLPGDHYKIPYGGMYRWISCPNYLGETLQWIGWAVATWSLPGFVFAVWTLANLVPRAHSHHLWYRSHFPDYPSDRKALIPFLF